MKKLEDFINKSILVHGDKYDYSPSNYITCDTDLLIRCKKHDFIFKQRPTHHLNGSGCPKCSNKYKPTTQEFIDKSIEIHGDKYLYDKTIYKSNNENVIITCKKHGDFEQTPTHHINRFQGCPKCSNSFKSNTEEFIKKSKNIFGDIFNYDEVEYKNWKTKVKLFCKKHKHFFYVNPNAHLSKEQGCPKCQMSKSEFKIYKILEENNIDFEYQKTFDLCRNIKRLPFDFYLPKINVCIEFDGRHHIEPIEKFGGLKNLENVFLNDKIKNDFCKKNKIKLIRISHTENSYEKLRNQLKINQII